MKVLFITAIHDLMISENLGRGDKICPELFITNDQSIINNLINKEFTVLAGIIESNYIRNSDVVIYGKNEVIEKNFLGRNYLIRLMKIANFFLILYG